MPHFTIQDIMTKPAVCVHPDTSLLEASKLLYERGFSGVPVTDDVGKLVGILTEYDMIAHESVMHLPTLQKVMADLPVYSKDAAIFKENIKQLEAITVKDVMNTDPLVLVEDSSPQDVISLFRSHHKVNPVPVVNQARKVIGIVSRFDIIKLFVITASSH